MGSKEGILLISLAFVNPGDKVLVPDPGYPTYTSASRLVDAEILTYDLKEENGWMPDYEALEKMDLSGVKLMWTNYPNMPTGTPAAPDTYRRLVEFGRKHNILIVNDNPYSFILNDSPRSILAEEGARECCLEMNSLSKAHNMSGWRIGMVCGDKDYVAQILKVKSQMDSGMFRSMQLAAVKALAQGPGWFEKLNAGYKARLKKVCELFDVLGVSYNPDSQGLFVWGKVSPDNAFLSADTSKTLGERVSDKLLYEAGVFVTPGMVFGKNGNDYIRASLCATESLLDKAIIKVKNIPPITGRRLYGRFPKPEMPFLPYLVNDITESASFCQISGMSHGDSPRDSYLKVVVYLAYGKRKTQRILPKQYIRKMENRRGYLLQASGA